MKHLILILAVLLMACSCTDDKLASAFSARDEVRLQVGGVEIHCYDPLTWQMGFSAEKKQFRVHTDNMSDYFTLTLSKIPQEDDEQVTGTVVYTTNDNIVTRRNITLKVLRLEGDRIWFWNQSGEIGLEVRTLD